MNFLNYVREVALAVVITLKVTDQVEWSWLLIFGIYGIVLFLTGFFRGVLKELKK